MSKYPRNLPVSGGDYFNLALYHPHSFEDKPDSSCQMSLVLDASFSFDLLAETLNRSRFFIWISTAQLNLPLPFMLPAWGDKSPTSASIIRQDNIIKTRSGISLLVEETDNGQQTLNFFWPHQLMDARGAEILIKNLQNVYLTGSDLSELVLYRQTSLRQKLRSLCRYHKSINQARRAVHYITHASRSPIAILARSNTYRERKTTRHHTIIFSGQDTALLDEQCRKQGAGFTKSLFYLAVTIQAVDTVLAWRKEISLQAGSTDNAEDLSTEGDYVIPVPIDLRLRGKSGAAMSNHISTLIFRVERGSAAHLEESIKSLKIQMTAQIEKGVPEDCRLMMDLFRRMPIALYSKAMLGPTGGQIASFFFSDIGESLSDTEDFLGARVAGVTHFAPARNPPGLTVVFLRHGGCLKVTLSYMENCLAPDELNHITNAFRAGLLGGGRPR